MSRVSIRLFGNVAVTSENGPVTEVSSGKRRSLFYYLLINHDRMLSRELVASAHWPNCTTVESKKYLRTALWQLRNELNTNFGIGDALQVDAAFVRLNTGTQVWLDVAEFERAHVCAGGIPPERLDDSRLAMIRAAVELYAGDLLPNFFDDWCSSERERLQSMYMLLLDKLLARSEIEHDCPSGRRYGSLLLRCDPVCELTYQRLMRLYDTTGDRAEALAVYERCVRTLQQHLGVEPSKVTTQLCQQIRSETSCSPVPASPSTNLQTSDDDVVAQLSQVVHILSHVQKRLSSNLDVLSHAPGLHKPQTKRGPAPQDSTFSRKRRYGRR
jgi:DNA-binding SARP family transcriptional activator